MDFDFTEAGNLDTLDRVLPEIEHIVPEHDKVLNVFIVDLEEADPNRIVPVNLVTLHMLEQFLHGIKHDARILLAAEHCVGLACASLAVGKHR